MNTIKCIDNALNMANTTKVFSPLFIQIVRILMTLGCNPMVIQRHNY